LLKAFFLPAKQQTALLRAEIRREIAKELGAEAGGGNFYTPFWSDAKNHIRGIADVRVETASRVSKNPRRKRLYPRLQEGFLNWWENKRRWTNLEFGVEEFAPKARYRFDELNATVKVENLIGITIGEDDSRLIYPYFYEQPIVTERIGQLGLWLMSRALSGYNPDDMRMLDILRSNSNSIADFPFRGDEEEEFLSRYIRLILRWEELRKEY